MEKEGKSRSVEAQGAVVKVLKSKKSNITKSMNKSKGLDRGDPFHPVPRELDVVNPKRRHTDSITGQPLKPNLLQHASTCNSISGTGVHECLTSEQVAHTPTALSECVECLCVSVCLSVCVCV